MGRKKRISDTRPNPKPLNHPPPDINITSLSLPTTDHNPTLDSSLPHLTSVSVSPSVSDLFAMESEGYSVVKLECEKALNAIRRGNHTKAVRLMKELCSKYDNNSNGNSNVYLALVYRVQGTVYVKVAGIMDDPNAKRRYLKNAVESARKAAMLSPNSVEFAHFYANLVCETATELKDYEDSVRECERGLMIKEPIDPGKESLQDERELKIGSADGRIENVRSELRALVQRANIGSISSWMRGLGNGGDNIRVFPVRRVFEDPMDVRVVQGRRVNDVKKASKTDEERKREIEVKVAAARLLQQKQECSESRTEGEKGPESSSGPSQRIGERRKSGKVKKNTDSERKDCVLAYWKSMSTDMKKDLYRVRVMDIKDYFKSLKDGLAYEVINEALLFAVSNNGWSYWMCCQCGEKFADAELHKRHIVREHMDRLSPKLQAVLPLDVDSEWTEMLLTHPWRPLDVDAAVRMIELHSDSSVSNPELASDSYDYEGMWDLSSGEKKYEDGCNGMSAGCVPMECDQSEGRDRYLNPDSWPLSDDIERTKLLEKIKTLFQLLSKHKCLAASHLTKVIQFAVEELHPQLVNYGVEQSPFCICLLGATELKKVLMFLQELSHACGVGRYSEKGNSLEESNIVTQVNGMSENIVIDQDGSSLLLDEDSLPFKLNAKSCEDNDDDSFLSWIFLGPTSREELTFWTRTRDENMHKGIEILENISKEFLHLQSLCDRKLEHMSCEEALQLIEDLCLEEDKRREHATEFVHQSYESILRKRREEISRDDHDVTHVNRFEVEVLSNVLQEADSMNLKQFGFEDTYGDVNVNSHVCDLESGEDDWRVNDYFQQLDSSIKSGIRKQKEQLSVELSKIDARIMLNLSEIQQLEAKLGPLSAHDFGLIVVPLVKSYLRAHLENLAEKDATEKSDAAREAFLAELALDSKKGTGDIPKHLNDKVKDKRKNKEYRKTRDSKPTRTGELHVLPNEKAEKASWDPNVIDEQPSESVDEVGVPFHEQEDEVRRRKIELEAEERKLEATLEYQRRIEDETKQRHLAEQHKYSSRTTPMSMEPMNQSNGLLIPPEDGLSERTGLLDLGIVENGASLYESRAGRRGRRQKNMTKLSDGRQKPLSSGKEATEFGQNTYSDRLQDTSSGDNGTCKLMLQAQEDDEKRFQADLSKAVRQSLDAFHSHKQYSSISGLIPEDMLIEGEDSCVTSIEVPPDNLNTSDVYGTGLKNEVGEYNCFLNVIIQSLWHIRRFREELLSTSTSFHLHVGDPCVTCALYDIFRALNSASTDSKVQAVAPTSLRIALSKLYPESNFFQESQMNDASEVLGVIFDCLHQSFTSVTGPSGTEPVENNIMGSWECTNKACTAHSLFGLDIFERMNCYDCGLETRRLKYTSFFHQINANALRTMKVMCPEGSFDELLNLVEMNHQLACDLEDGGCGKLNYIHHILSTPPHVFTTGVPRNHDNSSVDGLVLGWQNTCESVEDIKATLAALSTEIDLSVLYRGLDPNNAFRLVSVVCYYGQHYHCFAYNRVHQRWVMYDDKTVKVIGRWEDVVSACEKGHLQPQVLFYEAIN